MEDFWRFDENRWQAGKNINHVQLLHKEQQDDKRKIESFENGELVLWMPKATKIKRGKFRLPWKGHFKV